MAPRIQTIANKINKAIDQIKPGQCVRTQKTLESLRDNIGDGKPAKKRAPSEFAKFVKKEFPGMKKAHPGLSAPEIMKKIAKKWSASKK